jgi:hypothetical protein
VDDGARFCRVLFQVVSKEYNTFANVVNRAPLRYSFLRGVAVASGTAHYSMLLPSVRGHGSALHFFGYSQPAASFSHACPHTSGPPELCTLQSRTRAMPCEAKSKSINEQRAIARCARQHLHNLKVKAFCHCLMAEDELLSNGG